MNRQDIQNLTLPEGGRIEFDMSNEEYHAEPGANFSTLKYLAQSPLAYKAALDKKRAPTAAMSLGTVAHLAILEKAKFLSEVVTYDGRRAGKAWNEFEAEHANCYILKPAEYQSVLRMSEMVEEHTEAAYSFHDGLKEVSLFWIDPATGILCKARIDSVSERFLTDLKTTSDIHPSDFSRSAARFMYHGQIAHYVEGWQVLAGIRNTPVRMVTVHSSPPHDVVVYNVMGRELDMGLDLVRGWLKTLAEINKTKKYPGISKEPVEFSLPGWCYSEEEEG